MTAVLGESPGTRRDGVVHMVLTVLPLALVVGLSPVGILPAVILLMTPRARSNGPAYLAAWLVGLTLVVTVALLLGSLVNPDPVSEEGVGWIKVATGAVFLVMAGVKWGRRPRPGQAKEPPAWMAALDAYTPRQSARLGGLLAAGNPKNLAMALAAGAEIAILDYQAGPAVGVAVFVIVGSLGIALPVLAHAILGDRAAPGLARGRSWLERNSTALSVGVLVVLGALLLANGLPGAL